jgi:hypothetical protein
LLAIRLKEGVGRDWHFPELVGLAQGFSEVNTREIQAVRPPRVSSRDDGDKLVLDELPQYRVLTAHICAIAQRGHIESSEGAIAELGRDLFDTP